MMIPNNTFRSSAMILSVTTSSSLSFFLWPFRVRVIDPPQTGGIKSNCVVGCVCWLLKMKFLNSIPCLNFFLICCCFIFL